MNSGETNEFEARYNARVAKVREAAAVALKELDRLRSAGPVTQEAFDAEVTHHTKEAPAVRMRSRSSPDGRWYRAIPD